MNDEYNEYLVKVDHIADELNRRAEEGTMYEYFFPEDGDDGFMDMMFSAGISNGQLYMHGVRVVLGTGGPHLEIDTNRERVVCYGWFGSNEATAPLSDKAVMQIDEIFEEIFNNCR